MKKQRRVIGGEPTGAGAPQGQTVATAAVSRYNTAREGGRPRRLAVVKLAVLLSGTRLSLVYGPLSVIGNRHRPNFMIAYMPESGTYARPAQAFQGGHKATNAMAIDIYLQDIHGRRDAEVLDFDYCFAHIWPVGDKSFPLLRYIDPYGSTVFNGSQMPEVRRELEVLAGRALTSAQRDILCRISELAVECQKHPQTFLRFAGD